MDEQTEDEKVFGLNAWVYCSQHRKPHLTGWCSISARDKLGLGMIGQENARRAYDKCREFHLPIYGEENDGTETRLQS